MPSPSLGLASTHSSVVAVSSSLGVALVYAPGLTLATCHKPRSGDGEHSPVMQVATTEHVRACPSLGLATSRSPVLAGRLPA